MAAHGLPGYHRLMLDFDDSGIGVAVPHRFHHSAQDVVAVHVGDNLLW